MKEIQLTTGGVALVDDEDFDWLSQFKWISTKKKDRPYAMRFVRRGVKMLCMHRIIIDAPTDKLVDHINGNTLDNRKSNLRLCTNAENCRNAKKYKTNTSGYKGVSAEGRRWKAGITFEQKKIYLGTFDIPQEAHEAYKSKAKELFGEFARFE